MHFIKTSLSDKFDKNEAMVKNDKNREGSMVADFP